MSSQGEHVEDTAALQSETYDGATTVTVGENSTIEPTHDNAATGTAHIDATPETPQNVTTTDAAIANNDVSNDQQQEDRNDSGATTVILDSDYVEPPTPELSYYHYIPRAFTMVSDGNGNRYLYTQEQAERRGFTVPPEDSYPTFSWPFDTIPAPSGLSLNVWVAPGYLAWIEVLRNEADTECMICKAHYVKGDSVAVLPCAGCHRFHLQCIREWHMSSARALNCPYCRHKLCVVRTLCGAVPPDHGQLGPPAV